jgi:hypothetical protein
MRDSSVIATNRPEGIVGWLFASVNTLNDIPNTELNKQLWREHMAVCFLEKLQSIRAS